MFTSLGRLGFMLPRNGRNSFQRDLRLLGEECFFWTQE